MNQYFFIPKQQLARLLSPFLKNTAIKPASAYRKKRDHISFINMLIWETKGDEKQLKFNFSVKATSDKAGILT